MLSPPKPNWACLSNPEIKVQFQIAPPNKFVPLAILDIVDTALSTRSLKNKTSDKSLYLVQKWKYNRIVNRSAFNQPGKRLWSFFKKGDSQDCKNYRGISLLSIVDKVFMKIIQTCLQKHWEQMSQEEQAGFPPHCGCCDKILSFHQLIEERIWYAKCLVVVFINFKSFKTSYPQTSESIV